MGAKVLGPAILVCVAVFLGFGIWALSTNRVVVGYNQNYAPDQPIAFSHQRHAGELQIDCRYCHTAVDVSRAASVPSLDICMNCHALVKKDSPALSMLKQHYADGVPVGWQKVHLLPDHVKFNHAAHTRAGKSCAECHGPVESMEVVEQFSSLSMGFCVNCHRQPENNAPINCATCHY